MKLADVTKKLKVLGGKGISSVKGGIENKMSQMRQTFTPRNIIANAHPALGLAANLIDSLKGKPSAKTLSKPKDDAEGEDDEGSFEEDLINAIDEGFEAANDKLDKIHKAMAVQETQTEKIVESESDSINIDNSANIREIKEEKTQTKLLEHVVKNTTPDLLQQKENEMENRKKGFSIVNQKGSNDLSPGKKEGDSGSGLLGSLFSGLGGAILGKLGLSKLSGKSALGSAAKFIGEKGSSAVKGLMTGAKSLGGKALDGVKGLAESGQAGKFARVLGGKGKVLGGLAAGAGALTSPIMNSNIVGNVLSKGSSLAEGAGNALTKVKGAIPSLSTVSEGTGKLLSSAKNVVAPASESLLAGGSKVLSGAGKIAGKALGTPLALGLGAYDAYNISKDDKLNSGEKKQGYSRVGGATAGALAGAKLGAIAGSFIAPGVGTAIGGILGAVGGGLLGEFGGDMAGKWLFNDDKGKAAVTPMLKGEVSKSTNMAMAKQVKETGKDLVPAASGFSKDTSPASVASNLADVSKSQTQMEKTLQRNNYLREANLENVAVKSQPPIVQISNPSNSKTKSEGSDSKNLGVPRVRDSNGTIERLLNRNLSTIISN